MGDSGSLLLGFALGSISLLNVSRTAALTSLIIPLLVAGVPIIDTFSAIVRRKRAHISIGQADKGHILKDFHFILFCKQVVWIN